MNLLKHAKAITIFVVAFVLVLGASLAFFKNIGLFEVRKIEVEMAGEIPQRKDPSPGPYGLKGRIEKNVKSFGMKKLWEIDMGDLKAAIAKDEWVRDVLISRSFPNRVTVIVEPKQVALLLIGSKGKLTPITSDGALLSSLPADAIPDVPLLRGETFYRNKDRRKSMVDFVQALPSEGALSAANISEIRLVSDDGVSVMLMQPKVEVKLGQDKLPLKVLRATQVVNYLSAHQQESRLIDASFSKKVLVRLRKGP